MPIEKKVKKIVFLGSKKLGFNILKSLYKECKNFDWNIIIPDDSEDDRSVKDDFVNFSKENNIDFFICKKNSHTKEIIKNVNPDIGFVCGWYWLINKSTLSLVKNGLWGMHNSLLPKYRGGAPLVWSIINNEKYIGSSIFKIEEGMDNGNILLQIKFALDKNMYINDALNKIEQIAMKELPSKWKLLIEDKAETIAQDESKATYCAQRIERDGKIDWTKNSDEIYNFIRAQSKPYPCAFTMYDNKKIKILKSNKIDKIYFGTPGQILSVNKKSVIISCGNNSALELLDCKLKNTIYLSSEIFKTIKARL